MKPYHVRALLCVLFVLATSGCIEMSQLIILNPDGRGKVLYEVRSPGESPINVTMGVEKKEKTLDDKKREAVLRELTKYKGVTAWKDVSAKWTEDGRFHFTGTAYFEHIEDFTAKSKNDLQFEHYRFARDKNKSLVLSAHKSRGEDSNKKLPDLARMTGMELDDFLLKQRVKYQATRPIFTMVLSDLQIKTVLRLPGDVQDVVGFKKIQNQIVSRELDGNAALVTMKKFMAQDNAALKAKIQQGIAHEVLDSFGASEVFGEASLKVDPVTEDQFDYDREVRVARDAYPALRKQFEIPAKTLLPGEEMKVSPMQ